MEKYIVALDGSERAPLVLKKAVAFGRRQGAKLIVVRAVPIPVEFPAEALAYSGDTLKTELIAEASRSLDQLLAREAPLDLLLDRREVRFGTPWQVICDLAEESGATTIILGTHGYSLVDRVLGTTAARVVNHAYCSVLVVRDEEILRH